ncbi:unnamed protein product [Hermetia illucens]|uniref:Uncharacterized protein n=1 Tax=Hermetia illucens TaxID=343691 RepID=A0A7R8YZK2_HERIL|nr:unnamed protein product [Hermetia illucens]
MKRNPTCNSHVGTKKDYAQQWCHTTKAFSKMFLFSLGDSRSIIYTGMENSVLTRCSNSSSTLLLQGTYLLHQGTCELESSEIVVVISNATYATNAINTEDLFSDILPIIRQVSTPQPYDTEIMKMRAELEKRSFHRPSKKLGGHQSTSS